jgi:formate hydrogenlyase subunit 4
MAMNSAMNLAMMFELAAQALQMLLVLALAPLVLGVTRKIKARLLRRIGPPTWQPYVDLWKLLHKEAVLAHNASWLYRVTPYLLFATTWVAAALVPTYAINLMFSWSADLIAIVALLATGRFALALAGMDVGTAFGGIGSSREMMIASLAEPAMLLVVFSVALIAGTTQLSTMASIFINGSVGLRVSLGLAMFAFVFVAIAENARIPVDNPATHLELTMVHEAMVLEYSGRHLAVIEAAAALKLVVYFSLLICLFVPFGIATDAIVWDSTTWPALAIGLAAYLSKLVLLAVLLPVGETMVAKMRVFRYPIFLGGAFAAAALAVFLLFVSQSF